MEDITFESTKLILSEVPDEKKFMANNGMIFRTLEELKNGLKKMDSKTFEMHVNSYKNDFSSWIYDCIGDIKLADDIREMTNQQEMLKKIKTRITHLKKTRTEVLK